MIFILHFLDLAAFRDHGRNTKIFSLVFGSQKSLEFAFEINWPLRKSERQKGIEFCKENDFQQTIFQLQSAKMRCTLHTTALWAKKPISDNLSEYYIYFLLTTLIPYRNVKGKCNSQKASKRSQLFKIYFRRNKG